MYEKGSGVQGFQQVGVNAVKTAVAHYQNIVARLGFLADGGDDFLRLSADQGVLAPVSYTHLDVYKRQGVEGSTV